jgi:hypothetical protein
VSRTHTLQRSQVQVKQHQAACCPLRSAPTLVPTAPCCQLPACAQRAYTLPHAHAIWPHCCSTLAALTGFDHGVASPEVGPEHPDIDRPQPRQACKPCYEQCGCKQEAEVQQASTEGSDRPMLASAEQQLVPLISLGQAARLVTF